MSSNRTNFNAWYVQVLEGLYEKRNAGIAVFMISLPLLERYLRRKHNVASSKKLPQAAMTGLCAIFPELQTSAKARTFWKVFRDGFLHEATVQKNQRRGAALPGGQLTHDMRERIRLEADGGFIVNPVLFSRAVIDTIIGDFAIFEAPTPPLPQINRLDPVTIPSQYIGTGSART